MTGIGLDTSAEPWIGTFPGLGRVLVHHDGRIDTEPDGDEPDGDGAGNDEPDNDERSRALRHGWGVPLAHLRLGRRFVNGIALVDPDDRCLLLHGPGDATADVALALLRHGWAVLGQRLQPVSWDGATLVAHPSGSPFLVDTTRAKRHALGGTPIRTETDCVAVDIARIDTARPVAAMLKVLERRAHHTPFIELAGHDRFEACTQLIFGDRLARTDDAERPATEAMAEALRLTALPHAVAAIIAMRDRTPADEHHPDPDLDTDLAAITAWWARAAHTDHEVSDTSWS